MSLENKIETFLVYNTKINKYFILFDLFPKKKLSSLFKIYFNAWIIGKQK